jgi:hypothetical protein
VPPPEEEQGNGIAITAAIREYLTDILGPLYLEIADTIGRITGINMFEELGQDTKKPEDTSGGKEDKK